MQMDERILAEGCREGDGAARRELYDRFAGPLMAVCMRYAGDRATAEDLLHDAFLKIYGAFGKFSYRGWAILFTAFSFAVSNVGLSAIINYSIPVLMLIYPPAIALITLAFIGRFFGHDRIVYIAVMIPTWIAALFDFMKTLPGSAQTALHLDAPIQFAAANLPLFDKNLGWLLPAVIGFAIGMIWHLSRPKNAAAA